MTRTILGSPRRTRCAFGRSEIIRSSYVALGRELCEYSPPTIRGTSSANPSSLPPAAIPGRANRGAALNVPRWETTLKASAPSTTYQGGVLRAQTPLASQLVQHVLSHCC